MAMLLVDPDQDLVDAWHAEFIAHRDAVDVHHGFFQDRYGTFDAIISPGNSYGQMDGGIDGVISREFGLVQRRVWSMIAEDHHGYLPVGTAAIVPTGDDRCPWLVYAPTMRIPMRLHDGHDIAIHDALWAALLAVERHNQACQPDDMITTAACPGFGTGVGQVKPQRAAQLMAAAYSFWRGAPTAPISQRESWIQAT